MADNYRVEAAKLGDSIAAYELALQIISDYGAQLAGEECANIAYKGETGDTAWLLAWQPPVDVTDFHE